MLILGKLLFCQDSSLRKVVSLPVRVAKVEPHYLQVNWSTVRFRIQYRVIVNNEQVYKTNVPLLR